MYALCAETVHGYDMTIASNYHLKHLFSVLLATNNTLQTC